MVICIYIIILCLLTILLNFIVLEIELNDIRKHYILQINFKLYVYPVTGHNRIVGSYMRRASKERSVFIHISDKLKLYLIIDIHRYI